MQRNNYRYFPPAKQQQQPPTSAAIRVSTAWDLLLESRSLQESLPPLYIIRGTQNDAGRKRRLEEVGYSNDDVQHFPTIHNDDENSSTCDWMRLNPGLVELVGEAGTGKTQVALSLCVQTATCEHIKHVNSGNNVNSIYPAVLYISLQGTTAHMTKALNRLKQIANGSSSGSEGMDVKMLLQRISVRSIHNVDELSELLEHSIPAMLDKQEQQQQKHGRTRLIILDSLADLFRSNNNINDTTTTAAERAARLVSMASKFQIWSQKYRVTVLCLNQVSGSNQQAALGAAWGHCVTTRYLLRRREVVGRKRNEDDKDETRLNRYSGSTFATASTSATVSSAGTAWLRHITIDKSAGHSVDQNAEFVITASGVYIK